MFSYRWDHKMLGESYHDLFRMVRTATSNEVLTLIYPGFIREDR